MLKYHMIIALPLGLMTLAGCTAQPSASNNYNAPATGTPANSVSGPNTTGANVTASDPGYIALKAGDYPAAAADFRASNAKRPNSAFDELNLGAAYQRQGRMDLAEPLYRLAMTHGHNVPTTDTTTKAMAGKTVEEIACHNLAIGLIPASTEGTATPCQTTLVVAVVATPGPVASGYAMGSYNTYFKFDEATLTPEAEVILYAAAKDIRDNPSRKVYLIGRASSIGSDDYNMDLSKQRAIAVRDALIANGVPPAKIETRWIGEGNLSVPQQEGQREPLNRSVGGTVR